MARHLEITKARFVEPMQCRPVERLPEGAAPEYELKFDGYRALAIKSAGRVMLMSRNAKDFAGRFPRIAQAFEKLPDETIIDGEIVALDEGGRPSFNALQNYNHAGSTLKFYAFDLFHLSGSSLLGRPLNKRRELLCTKVMPRLLDVIHFSETLDASAVEVIEAVRTQGLEGVIAKRCDSLYEPDRRSGAWVKLRVNQGQELVVGGYVPGGRNFDSIIVGYYRAAS
jgi:ATP-dependent DNA ligase